MVSIMVFIVRLDGASEVLYGVLYLVVCVLEYFLILLWCMFWGMVFGSFVLLLLYLVVMGYGLGLLID